FGETIWPAAKVVRLCADLPEAYAYLRSQANLDDPDERLRLAQWCHLRGLREQALKDVQAAAELRPGNAKTQRLLEHLQRPQVSAVVVASPKTPEPVIVPPVSVNSESLSMFVTRVEPILMNACARCHASDKGGNYHLTRDPQRDGLGRKALYTNLAATL